MSFLIGSARTTIASLKNGEIGTPGPAGEDGKTSYVHIAYSNSEDGSLDFSTSDSSNRAYIGMYTDFTELDSTDHTKYTWQRTKGEQGESGRDGVAGKDGVGLKNTEVSYAKSTNGQTPPESGSCSISTIVIHISSLWRSLYRIYLPNPAKSFTRVDWSGEKLIVPCKILAPVSRSNWSSSSVISKVVPPFVETISSTSYCRFVK